MYSSTQAAAISFFFQKTSITLADRTGLKKYLTRLFKSEGKNCGTINYIFCTDKALLEINRQFLQHDFYTDIITFDLSEGELITAEIYISTDRVRDNARAHGASLKSELHRVIFHGALHLCGYKDKTTKEEMEMRAREDFYLKKYFK